VQKVVTFIFKAVRKVYFGLGDVTSKLMTHIIFLGLNVRYKDFITSGIPYVSVASGGDFEIGAAFQMNNSLRSNPIGRAQRCIFFVDSGAKLKIGNNVGMSQAALVCHTGITIGNDVKIGAGVCIYDSDFHSLDPEIRRNSQLDLKNKIKAPVVIKDNVFIGAHSTILKGVSIGENAVIGACSVVTKNVPDNEIWGGNPARLIKRVPSNSDFAKYE
jgi:acetyltransferase-like isoleucine patch superfamily enzyme